MSSINSTLEVTWIFNSKKRIRNVSNLAIAGLFLFKPPTFKLREREEVIDGRRDNHIIKKYIRTLNKLESKNLNLGLV